MKNIESIKEMRRYTINSLSYIQTIDWLKGKIIDWGYSGKQFDLDGNSMETSRSQYSLNFDGSITSQDGTYSFIYQRLGTKGLLFKNGDLIKEINRSYCESDIYEYPVAFITFKNQTFLIHCPFKYCQLDFENVETGEIITNIEGRSPYDIFHSRLSISPDNNFLMVCGWAWHPVDTVEIFNVSECLNNPLLLDESAIFPEFGAEINSASFIDNNRILIASSDKEPFDYQVAPILPPKHLAIWDLKKNEITNPVKVEGEIGNLFAINDEIAWDLYKFPKIINIKTGKIIEENREINSGLRNNSMLFTNIDKFPQIIFDKKTSKIAIKIGKSKIEILSP